MTKQKIALFAIALFFLPALSLAQESIEVNFMYEGDHGVDLSKMSGSMKFAEFSDRRSLESSRMITSESLGNSKAAKGYQAEKPLPEIVRDALVQGFKSGGARIVDSDEAMSIVGNIISSDTSVVDRGGVESIQITIRTNVQLQSGGRTVWETILFGRGVAPASEGLTAAIHAALDRTIRELLGDDYFLLEVM